MGNRSRSYFHQKHSRLHEAHRAGITGTYQSREGRDEPTRAHRRQPRTKEQINQDRIRNGLAPLR